MLWHPFGIRVRAIQGGAGLRPEGGETPDAGWRAPVRIEQRLFDEIIKYLIAALPNEGCGLVAFDGDRPVKVYPGHNILLSETRFRMDDLDVLRALEEMDRHGWWLGAIFHSHPHSAPTPSTTDLREANWPDALMLIVSLQREEPEARAWRIERDTDTFHEVAIEPYSDRARWLTELRQRPGWRAFVPNRQRDTQRARVGRQVWLPVGHGAPGRLSSGRGLATRGSAQTLSATQREPQMMASGPGARRATIGILGGMGPLATADLYRKIVESTSAEVDQEHIPVVIWGDPRVPDRGDALLRGGEDPTPWLVHGGRALAAMGADFIVMPCNTAHAFLPRVQPGVERPILSMIDAAVDAVLTRQPGAAVVGLLATSGTIASEVYQCALRDRGLDAIVPDDDAQQRNVMEAILAIKAGRGGEGAAKLLADAARELVERGAEALLAACTEIPLVLRQEHVSAPLIDATDELARAAIATARHLDDAAHAGAPVWETTQISVLHAIASAPQP